MVHWDKESPMVYEYTINGRRLKSGDIISTTDGNNSIYSLGFVLLGHLIPGEVDHTVIYIGPDGLCVESGMRGVISFRAGRRWSSKKMFKERGLIDTFFAASSVFAGRGLSPTDEQLARTFIRAYALGSVGKPYNINFLDPDTESCVYCSQLAYLAYKKVGIDLNVGSSGIPGIDRIIFPEEILRNTALIPKTV
jgi:hypothetical protein